MTDKPQSANQDELQELLANDTGGRNPGGLAEQILVGVALAWSLFQIWIASPLPFMIGAGVFNDTEARSIHLAFSVFLAFTAYPAFKRSPRDHIPLIDWMFALVGSFAAAYLFLFYNQLSERPGAPITQDLVVGVIGMVLLLEACRRALGPPLTLVALVFLLYTFFGSSDYLPDLLRWKGANLSQVVNHQWITTEGVFGIALGVSTSFVFLFVLFGALLDKAGAGNYFIKVAFSLLGHLKGGPAKAAVVASGLTGLISGSSIANVVTTGTFTIPMMRRVGFSAEKGGAVEVASSVNGQIMPPVMGAAAFLMVEYVGITYFEVVKHAFLPALISYIALVYIVHLEACKANMQGLARNNEVKLLILQRLAGILFGFVAFALLAMGVYFVVDVIKTVTGVQSFQYIGLLLLLAYLILVGVGSSYPELELDDPNAPVVKLPEVRPTVMSGLYYLLPVLVLIWCLMIERLSPALSAYWATVVMIIILLTQRPLKALFRNQLPLIWQETKAGLKDLHDGLVAGARNMIGIGIATATAGIIVGAVSQTGVGAVLADVVEEMSFGIIMLMLFWTAILSLILGMGLPTTANYIVVSSLLAPVIVELGTNSGLIVPLIAVHLFVFYFGIMADVTPPVGLASFAAAAVSGGDPIRTGFTAFFYSLRTAALPFLFIFNTDLLLINVDWLHGIFIFIMATIAMLIFAAATQGYFLARNRIWESALMLLIAFTLFRPGFWMDMVVDPYDHRPGGQIEEAITEGEPGGYMKLGIDGFDEVGEPRQFVVKLPIPEGDTGAERLENLGLELIERDGDTVVDFVGFDSPASKAMLQFDQVITEVMMPVAQPAKELFFIPALLLLWLIAQAQRRRVAIDVK